MEYAWPRLRHFRIFRISSTVLDMFQGFGLMRLIKLRVSPFDAQEGLSVGGALRDPLLYARRLVPGRHGPEMQHMTSILVSFVSYGPMARLLSPTLRFVKARHTAVAPSASSRSAE